MDSQDSPPVPPSNPQPAPNTTISRQSDGWYVQPEPSTKVTGRWPLYSQSQSVPAPPESNLPTSTFHFTHPAPFQTRNTVGVGPQFTGVPHPQARQSPAGGTQPTYFAAHLPASSAYNPQSKYLNNLLGYGTKSPTAQPQGEENPPPIKACVENVMDSSNMQVGETPLISKRKRRRELLPNIPKKKPAPPRRANILSNAVRQPMVLYKATKALADPRPVNARSTFDGSNARGASSPQHTSNPPVADLPSHPDTTFLQPQRASQKNHHESVPKSSTPLAPNTTFQTTHTVFPAPPTPLAPKSVSPLRHAVPPLVHGVPSPACPVPLPAHLAYKSPTPPAFSPTRPIFSPARPAATPKNPVPSPSRPTISTPRSDPPLTEPGPPPQPGPGPSQHGPKEKSQWKSNGDKANDADDDEDMDDDNSVIESLYEDNLPDWEKLYKLMNRVLTVQDALVRDVKKINDRTQGMASGAQSTKHGANGQPGGHVSPPDPPKPVDWDQTVPCTWTAGRRARAERRIALMGLIREIIFKLLGRRSIRDPLPSPPPNTLRTPSLLNFHVRWDESPKGPFNRLAVSIVAQKICYEHPGMLTKDELEELPEMITKHIKYLCRCYKNQTREDTEEFRANRLKRCSAGAQKRTLFDSRLRLIDRFPAALGKHRKLIVHLAVPGTSSDEEEPLDSGIYRIKRKTQLSSRVTQLKRDLDHVYKLYYKGPGSKGSQVHYRTPSDLVSTQLFTIEGLPVTCISRAWHQSLDNAEKEFYRFQPHRYDFSFPTALFELRPKRKPRARESSVDSNV